MLYSYPISFLHPISSLISFPLLFSFRLALPASISSSPQSQFQSPYGKLYILWAGDGHERAYGHVRTITKLNERTLAILLLYFISISFPPFLHIFRFSLKISISLSFSLSCVYLSWFNFHPAFHSHIHNSIRTFFPFLSSNLHLRTICFAKFIPCMPICFHLLS